MSQIVDDLRQVAIEIKTETQIGGNTAARVGGAFERVADALEGTQQIEDMDAAVAAVQQAAQENEQTIQDIVNSLAVVQTTGQSTSDVMSQKAVTDEIEDSEEISVRKWTQRYGYIDNNGAYVNNVNYNCTFYIDVEEVTKIVIKTDYNYCFYDEDKVKVGNVTRGTGSDTTINASDFPEGAKYIMASSHNIALVMYLYKKKTTALVKTTYNEVFGSRSEVSSAITPNTYGYIATNGTDGANPNYKRTGYIAIDDDVVSVGYSIGTNQYNACVVFYDNERVCLPTYYPASGSSTEIVIPREFFPTGAAFVRFCGKDGTITSCVINKASYPNSLAERIERIEDNSAVGKFLGKKIAIVGDSISTFRGWLPSDVAGYVGATYAYHYPNGDVTTVDKTWWYMMAESLGLTPTEDINNCSWSGSQVCGNSTLTEADTPDSYGYCGCSTKRVSDMSIRGYNPDIVIIYLGCNDWGRSSVTLGAWEDAIPAEGVINIFYKGLTLMIKKIQVAYPNARIFICTYTEDTHRDSDTSFPSKNTNGVALYTWNNAVKDIAEKMACDVIDLHDCGINYFNASQFTAEGLHPNAAGHRLLAKKVIAELISKY